MVLLQIEARHSCKTMKTTAEITTAKERVLDAAEKLFMTRGYKMVTLRDIAIALKLNHTSLYHHAPGGKETLFVEVMERSFRRHQDAMEMALGQAGPDLKAQLQAVTRWMLSQPPIDFMRMMSSDMPSISKSSARRLTQAAYNAFLGPLDRAFLQAHQAGQIRMLSDPRILSGAFLAIVQNAHAVPIDSRQNPTPKAAMVDELIDVLLLGLKTQPS